jgi:cytosine/adenosine deaminase-related metal-dependent hydrolase
MRFIQANWVYPVSSAPLENGIIVVNDDGKIEDVLKSEAAIGLGDKLEKVTGILCPGFVNTHCHLELSHLKGKLSQKRGLPEFVKEILAGREAEANFIFESMRKADLEMYENGIVAVGDISNRSDSLTTKTKSKIFYHTFVELFDIVSTKAQESFETGVRLRKQFTQAGLSCSLVPHAPYTVSKNLFEKINNDVFSSISPMTIHNQETVSENMYFKDNQGALYELMSRINPELAERPPQADSSLKYYLPLLTNFTSLLLVHNTYTTAEDIRMVIDSQKPIYWALCANANLFIEDKLPPIELLDSLQAKITIGTDSYASNWSLSILDELKVIQKAVPKIGLEKLIQWATLNGARMLGQHSRLGSFEKGKTPGILLLNENIPVESMRILTSVRRLI